MHSVIIAGSSAIMTECNRKYAMSNERYRMKTVWVITERDNNNWYEVVDVYVTEELAEDAVKHYRLKSDTLR